LRRLSNNWIQRSSHASLLLSKLPAGNEPQKTKEAQRKYLRKNATPAWRQQALAVLKL